MLAALLLAAGWGVPGAAPLAQGAVAGILGRAACRRAGDCRAELCARVVALAEERLDARSKASLVGAINRRHVDLGEFLERGLERRHAGDDDQERKYGGENLHCCGSFKVVLEVWILRECSEGRIAGVFLTVHQHQSIRSGRHPPFILCNSISHILACKTDLLVAG